MTTLAMSDGWNIALFIVQLLVTVGLALTLLWVKNTISKIDRVTEQATQKAEDLVDQKMATLGEKFVGITNLLDQRIDQIIERLRNGDRDFKDLDKRDHDLEIKFNQRIDLLKDWIRENCASRHHVDAIDARMLRMEKIGGSK